MQRIANLREARRVGPFYCLAGWVLGTVLQLQQPQLWDARYYLTCALAACVAYLLSGLRAEADGLGPIAPAGRLQAGMRYLLHARFYMSTWQQRWRLLLAMVVLGFCATGLRAAWYSATQLDVRLEGRDVLVTGLVAGMPQLHETGVHFRLEVERATLGGVVVQLPQYVNVGWYSSSFFAAQAGNTVLPQPAPVRAGERWQMVVRLKAPHGNRNPYGFDYELWLWEQGVQALAYVRTGAGDAAPQRFEQTWRYPVAGLRQAVRDRIFSHVQSRQFAGLIAALVVGDQQAIERQDWDVFRATGVAHLVSISGLHITMFAWAAAWVLGALWRRSTRLCLAVPAPVAALLGGVVLAIAYSVFSGWGLPAQRTCWMLLAVAFLRVTGKKWPWPQVWILACAVVLVCDPWAWLQASFWLSFVAVAVLFASGAGGGSSGGSEVAETSLGSTSFLSSTSFARFMRAVSRRIGPRVRSMLHEQFVVTLALTPLTLLWFGQMSVVGMVANAFAIFWVTLVVTPLSMLGVLLPPVWGIANGAIAVLMAWLEWLSAMPWATFSLPMAPVGFSVAAVLGGGLLVLRLPWHLRLFGLPLLLAVFLWRPVLPLPGSFEVLALDVGQGTAVLLRTSGHALLFDAGPRYSVDSNAGHRVLVPLLQALQTRLDTVVLSHRDIDHVGGAAAVLAMQPQALLLSSLEPGHPLQVAQESRQLAQRCVAGQRWHWDGVWFEVLHPTQQDYTLALKPNAVSCVLRVSNGQQSVLLTGDIEKAQEALLLQRNPALQADVLLVAHHGSKTSSSEVFLDAVRPRIALVQSGYRNRFGHPAAQVVQRFVARDIALYDSPHCGAMLWHSAQAQTVQCWRDVQTHYWSHRIQ